MWTVGNLLAEAGPFLARKGVPSARLEAELLLAHTLDRDRVALYAAFAQPLSSAEVDAFREACKRRIRGEPTAYITGEREFFSLAFHVSPEVLIPRPETEELVQVALDILAESAGSRDSVESVDPAELVAHEDDAPAAADVGTGSGCIAVTLAVLNRKVRILASDQSPGALTVAVRNAERHGVADRIEFAQGSFMEPLAAARPPEGFHLIVSNPPYIDPSGTLPVDPGVKEFEPGEALFTPQGDPLFAYREIFRGAGGLLRREGCVLVEIADGMANEVEDLGSRLGLRPVLRRKDLAGIERVMGFGLKS
jgi:release factor glutamine methyltransferase